MIKSIYFNTTPDTEKTVRFRINVQYTDGTPAVNQDGIASSPQEALQNAMRIAQRCPVTCPIYGVCNLDRGSDPCDEKYIDMYQPAKAQVTG